MQSEEVFACCISFPTVRTSERPTYTGNLDQSGGWGIKKKKKKNFIPCHPICALTVTPRAKIDIDKMLGP